MTGKTHIAGGMLAGSLVLYKLSSSCIDIPPLLDICIFAGSIAGSVTPDVDEVHSIAGRKCRIISIPFAITHFLFSVIAFLLPKRSRIRYNIKNISYAAGHQGIMHWPFTVIVLCGTLFLITKMLSRLCIPPIVLNAFNYYILGFGIGMMSHLVYDSLSGKVALLAPFSSIRLGVPIVPYGSIADTHIVRILSVGTSIYFFLGTLGTHIATLYEIILSRVFMI